MEKHDLFKDYQLSWLDESGPEGDVVLGSRIRLARNFQQIPFPNRADFSELAKVEKMAGSVLGDMEGALAEPFDWLQMDKLTPLQQQVLVEKQLISAKLLQHPQYRSAFISQDQKCSILVNEADHLRIQYTVSGLDLQTPWQMASKLDDRIEAKLDLAFDEEMGYLTSCPTNLGTGLRASVIVHLPGLVFTRQIQSITAIISQLGLSIRSLFGEEAEAVGNLFRISNPLTLGFTEEELIENLTSAVHEVIANEHRARKALQLYTKDRLEDEVWRALGTLRYARFLSEHEVLSLASRLRLGIDLGILKEIRPQYFTELLVGFRTSYLQNKEDNENLSRNEIDRRRADLVRQILADWSIRRGEKE